MEYYPTPKLVILTLKNLIEYIMTDVRLLQGRTTQDRVISGRLFQEMMWRRAHTNSNWEGAPRFLQLNEWHPFYNFRDAREIPESRRYPPHEEYEDRKTALRERGIRVKASVKFSYWDNRNPNLQIVVNRVNSARNPLWLTNSTVYGWRTPYHITVGRFDEDIKPIEGWKRHVRRLIDKFHDKEVHLVVSGFSRNGNVFLDLDRDPIASDPDFKILHAAYRTRNMTEREPWNVDEAHITQ